MVYVIIASEAIKIYERDKSFREFAPGEAIGYGGKPLRFESYDAAFVWKWREKKQNPEAGSLKIVKL